MGTALLIKNTGLKNSDYVDYLPLVAVELQSPFFLSQISVPAQSSGCPAPLSVLFTDLSENEAERTWDFENDGDY